MCLHSLQVIQALVAEGSFWCWPDPVGLAKTNFLNTILLQLKKLNRESVVVNPVCMGKARQVVSHGSETGALTYALHVLLKVLPLLDTLELKKACADTLFTQLKSKNYSVPAQVWEAVEQAKTDGAAPIFEVGPVADEGAAGLSVAADL